MFLLNTLMAVVGFTLLVTPVLTIWALVRSFRIATRLERLEESVVAIGRHSVAGTLETPPTGPSSHETSPEPSGMDRSPAKETPPPREREPEPLEPPPFESGNTSGSIGWQGIEERLASRWLIWIGGLALALGGVFLVKYSIDREMLSPAGRIVLGLLFGGGLAVGGEWLRRRPSQLEAARVGPNFVPQALSSAGLVTCFGSFFAAYDLYGLIGPLSAFIAMAVVATAGLALSLMHGPLVAVIGVLGAFAVPLLVQSEAPSAWALFPYLWFVAGSALAVVRFRAWHWLAWFALFGSAAWAYLWMLGTWQPGDAVALSAHHLVMLLLFAAPRFEQLVDGSDTPLNPFDPRQLGFARCLVQATSLVVCLLLLELLAWDARGAASLFAGALVLASLAASAYRLPAQESLLALAAATSLAAIGLWATPGLEAMAAEHEALARDVAPLHVPLIPDAFSRFCTIAAGLALSFAASGFAGLWRSRFPGLWAGVSVVVPLGLMAIVYWRLEAAGFSLPWAALGLGLATLSLAAAAVVTRSRAMPGMETALGCYCLAVGAAVTLSIAMTLEEKWWPIGLALQLPVAAWVESRLRIPFVRRAYLLVAVYVIARLGLQALDQASAVLTIFEATDSSPATPMTVLYSFGLPAAAFALAGRLFAKRTNDRLVMVLEAGTLILGFLLITLEIDQFVGAADGSPLSGLLEASLNSIAWLTGGLILLRAGRGGLKAESKLVAEKGAVLLVLAGSAYVLLIQVMIENPLVTGTPVGEWPFLNLLLLAYGAPAVLALLFRREAEERRMPKLSTIAGLASILLQVVYLVLQVRHFFHGPDLTAGSLSSAEGYAYSLAFLVYAGALLGLGVWRDSRQLRYLSLVLVLAVVTKVFLWDMSWLAGLFRVASFVCLGLSLVGVGLLYQRLILRVPEQQA